MAAVFPAEPGRVQHAAQKLMHIAVFCKGDDPRRAPVQPADGMGDASLRKIGRKRVFERKLLWVACRLMHGEPGRLVQNQDILIFKEHFERHGHGARARRIRRIANFCREHIASLHRGRCECAHAVEQDPRFAQLYPADERFGHAQLLRKQAFDRTPGKAFVNGERKRAHKASLEWDEHKYSMVGG